MSWFDRDSPEDHYCGKLDPPCKRCGRMDGGCVTVTMDEFPGQSVDLCDDCADDVLGIEQLSDDDEPETVDEDDPGPITQRCPTMSECYG